MQQAVRATLTYILGQKCSSNGHYKNAKLFHAIKYKIKAID